MKKARTKHRSPANGRAKLALLRNGNAPRPKRVRDRAAKKQALILAALDLFASKGFEVTTTREIAAAAGCAEGLIHRYFKGKAGLLAALLDFRVSREPLQSDHALQPEATLEDEFLQLVDREIERVWENRDFLRVLIPRAIVDPFVGTVMNRTLISVRGKAISDRLKRYQSRATLPLDTIEALAQMVGMLGFIFGFVRPVLLGQDRVRAKKMASTVARIFVNGSDHGRVVRLPEAGRTSALMFP
jgi:TetR/AcrR family transcriptional regulator, regulator of cefoperazone and chloramphenicol sensitivity